MGSYGEQRGSLSQYSTAQALREKFPRMPRSLNPNNDPANQLFHLKDDIKPGHIIVAYGSKSILGFGEVPPDSTYQFDDKEDVNWWGADTPGLQHWRRITWSKIPEMPIDISNDEELYRDLRQNNTIHKIDPKLNRKLKEIMQEIGSSSGYPTREQIDKAIEAVGKTDITKEELMKALEEIMATENVKPNQDWKSRTWENVKVWAEKIIE